MKVLLLCTIFCSLNFATAQNTVLDSIAFSQKKVFFHDNGKFVGENIDSLINEISKCSFLLIGEQHHTNEIPLFLNFLLQRINFDNYITEGNQSLTDLLEQTLKNSELSYNNLIKRHTDRFGFYTFSKDRKLLESFLLADKPVIELDQVFASSDVPLLENLSRSTLNKSAKKVYEELIKIAEVRWIKYKKNPEVQPPFNLSELPLLFSPELTEKLRPLLSQDISPREKQIIQDLIQSNEIYVTAIEGKGLESHEKRISLMKKNLLSNYDKLVDKRNLFKFGANHVTKHKSLGQGTPDVGSLVLNLADAQGKKSLHIAILEKSGQIGGLFDKNIETNGLAYLKPFSNLSNSENEWLLFDLKKVGSEVKKKNVSIKSTALTNFIDGFDYLIIIPKVTPQSKL